MHATPPFPPDACCREDEVVDLVHGFYARVREDDLLGPVFDRHVHDWPAHLAHLVDFWSALLRGTRRFNGAPMPRHMALPGLSAELFERWLALFAQATTASGNLALKAEADARAAMIAQRFWRQYQLEGHHLPAAAGVAVDTDGEPA